MPGLIDAHMHAYGSDVSVQKIESHGEAYRTAYAARMLGHALDCGFTTVRDVGGGDYGLSQALADRLIRGPRFFYAGRFLSMTGGHGDFRLQHDHFQCACGAFNSLGVIATLLLQNRAHGLRTLKPAAFIPTRLRAVAARIACTTGKGNS